ncbi:ABC transporter permease [Limobrevibacterium gyesilva]|uniref:ABC transporter permease n=1 Tax=Limobrevibacterium gyesilva TaxID=2991712 RepID=A0AA41YVQ8_9PROT|nr:ABC transporter permease [Limobrevibacterium gyesilva]MCW3477295.1 ABC transporter permease [Limobrevibacterium gyesilva]
MLTYLIRRTLLVSVTIWGVMTILFGLQHLSGDPTLLLLSSDATEDARRTLANQLGLDQPLAAQYAAFLWNTLTGDLGLSWKYHQPALRIVLEALPATALLTSAAIALGLAVAVPLGILAAVYRNSWIDTLASFIAVLGQSMPVYWSGLLLILLFSTTLRWLPSMGSDGAVALVLPAATLGLNIMARIERITRASMLEVLGQDFVRTLRSKGLSERSVLFRHGLRNASVPIVSMVGLQLSALLGGAVLIETVFAWPGVGRLAVNAVYARDFPLVHAAALVVTLTFCLVNMLVDVLCASLNPQIRLD